MLNDILDFIINSIWYLFILSILSDLFSFIDIIDEFEDIETIENEVDSRNPEEDKNSDKPNKDHISL